MNRLLLAGGALALLTTDLAAQVSGGVSLEARGRGRIEATTTATALFSVRNVRGDSARLMAHADVPTGWTVLTGASTILVAPGATETLVLSVAVPARARAGTYPLRVSLTSGENFSLVTDSVLVVVPARRGLDLELLDRPTYAIAPRTYEARFLVRNRGNAPSSVRLSAGSRIGAAAIVGDELLWLDAGATREISVRVSPHRLLRGAEDDVVEIAARQFGDSAEVATASARVTVVPEASSIDEYDRLPGQLRVRATGTSGVAPFEFSGAGALRDGGTTEIEVLVRGRGRSTHTFGEDDEYRVEIRTPSWRVRGGDHFFSLSPLTGAGRAGTGLGGELTLGRWSAGTFAQVFRHEPGKDREAAAFASVSVLDGLQIGLNAVSRETHKGTTMLLGGQAALQHGRDRASVELVRNTGAQGPALATIARVSGSHGRVAYDAGMLSADTGAAAQPGTRNGYVSANAEATRRFDVTVNASSRSTVAQPAGTPQRSRLDLASAAVSLDHRLTAEVSVAGRSTGAAGATPAVQRSFRLRAHRNWGPFGATLGAGRGMTTSPAAPARQHGDLHAALRYNARNTALSGFVSAADGGSLMRGPDGVVTGGGDVSFRFRHATDFAANFLSTRSDGRLRNQLDARLTQTLISGSTLTFRVRVADREALTQNGNAMFVEYGMPLRLPVARSRLPGRVEGRILDAESGRGISNALVRIGGQVAITDSRGQVAFANVPAGQHRVSLAQEQSLTHAVFIGDPTLRVDGHATRPATFELRLARGARLDVAINRFISVRTAMSGGTDSLALASPEPDVTLRLVSGRDTLYRRTDEKGRASFIDIPPGRWTLAAHSDAPARHQFEPDRLELTVAAGESRRVELRVVPRQRTIQVIGGDQELRSMPRERGSGSSHRQ